MSLRIAFVGPLKAGKTTACQYLASRYGTKTISLATPLKEELFRFLQDYRLSAMYGGRTKDTFMMQHPEVFKSGPCLGDLPLPPLGNYYDPIGWINKNKDEVRPLLQWWGTDFKRAQDENYWVKKLYTAMDQFPDIANDDCRFVNEAKFFMDNGFNLIAINPLTDDEAKGLHPSESDHLAILKLFPHVVVYNKKSSYEDFYNSIDEALYKLAVVDRKTSDAEWREVFGKQ